MVLPAAYHVDQDAQRFDRVLDEIDAVHAGTFPPSARCVCARGLGLSLFPVDDQSEHLVPLALGLLWLVAAGICRRRAAPPLICSAPMAIVLSWFVWLQAQGWPGTGDEKLSTLGEFALAVLCGLILGRLARSR